MLNNNKWLAATLFGIFCSACAQAEVDLQITEIWPGNNPGENLSEDWFEIVNLGDTRYQVSVDGLLFYDDESRDPDAADLISGISVIEPGEAVIVLISGDGQAAIDAFVNLWSPVYLLDGVQIGVTDGAGLGQGGDGVTLYIGAPALATEVDFEEFTNANAFGGQSFDVALQQFSMNGDMPFDAVATAIVNDANQPAVGSPGNQGRVELVGSFPVIQLLGDNPLVLQRNDFFVDPGAQAFDVEDGEISDAIVVSGDIIDTANFATFDLHYDVSDSDSNAAVTLNRDVIVTHPEHIPFAPVPANPSLFAQVATLGNLPGAEIPAFDVASNQVFVTGGNGLQIVDLTDPVNPTRRQLIDPAEAPINLNSSAVTSVDACGGLIAFAVPNEPQTDNGHVVFINAAGGLIRTVTVGALPDMVRFTSDCENLLVANEGEPDDGINPEGSVSVIDAKTGRVKTADFQRFNGREFFLSARGVRLFPGIAAANDLEPEYIAVSEDNRFAYVTLQEANSIAVIHIKTATVLSVLPLGLKDHNRYGNELDASDADFVINIQNWPLMGMFMPDAIAGFKRGGRQFFITANEGDARDEDERVRNLVLDPVAFPNAAQLQSDFNIGRIEVSTIDGDFDGDGDFDQLQPYGARSFSIWNRFGQLVFDSGSQIEAIVATSTPESFIDDRSDNKGPEPEGVEVGKIGFRQYAFVGLERTSQILVYDVSNPRSPIFTQVLQNPGDVAPEGLKFISRRESPNGCPALLVTNEDSNTLTVYQVTDCVYP